MPGGALHTWRRWGLPVVAAAGGIVGSVGGLSGLRHLSVRGRADDGMADRQRHRHRRGVLPDEVDHAAQRRSPLCADRRDRHRYVRHLRRRATLPDAGDSRQRRGAAVGGDRARRLLRAIGVRAFWPYLSICGTMLVVGVLLGGPPSGVCPGADRPVPAARAAPARSVRGSAATMTRPTTSSTSGICSSRPSCFSSPSSTPASCCADYDTGSVAMMPPRWSGGRSGFWPRSAWRCSPACICHGISAGAKWSSSRWRHRAVSRSRCSSRPACSRPDQCARQSRLASLATGAGLLLAFGAARLLKRRQIC